MYANKEQAMKINVRKLVKTRAVLRTLIAIFWVAFLGLGITLLIYDFKSKIQSIQTMQSIQAVQLKYLVEMSE